MQISREGEIETIVSDCSNSMYIEVVAFISAYDKKDKSNFGFVLFFGS